MSNRERQTSVCVIGAGVSGIASVKACLEAGLNVTCYEQSAHYGGLWHYQGQQADQMDEFRPSVMKTTILNTSKELSAFSDFPPADRLPNFMRHDLYMDYVRQYVAHFQIELHLKLRHEVLSCEPRLLASKQDDDKNKAGKQRQVQWQVRVRDKATGVEHELTYDKLMVAVGHHNAPFEPKIRGRDKFGGLVLHSGHAKDILRDDRFADKNCLVVGIGNSACDAANDLALVSNKCYLACHRGQWFLSRLTPAGLYDFSFKNRWTCFLSKVLPNKLVDNALIRRMQSATDHELLGLKPKHAPSELVPAVNDLFPYRVFTGGVVIKSSLLELTPTGAVFAGEPDTEHQVDVVLLATGYLARVPFLDLAKLGILAEPEPACSDGGGGGGGGGQDGAEQEFELYLNMFAPKLTLSCPSISEPVTGCREAIESMAFVGFVQPSGSIAVISELQARYAAQIFSGKLKLPSSQQMLAANAAQRLQRAKSIRSHSRDQLVGDWIGYQDRLARELGCKPKLAHLLFKDPQLWRRLLFGPSAAYQHRLVGPDSNWREARRTIMELDRRVYCGINEGKNHILFDTRLKSMRDVAKQRQTTADSNGGPRPRPEVVPA